MKLGARLAFFVPVFTVFTVVFVVVLKNIHYLRSNGNSTSLKEQRVGFDEDPGRDRTPRRTEINPAIRVMSAYFEERPSMMGPSVVVIGYQDKTYNETLHCFTAFPDKSVGCSPVETRVVNGCNRFAKTGYMTEMYYICKLRSERGAAVPEAVSLSQDSACSLLITASLSVSSHEEDNGTSVPHSFGVCLQTPIFKLNSFQVVVDFIEMNRLLGAETFTIYVVNVGTSVDGKLVTKLKQAYAEEDILEVVELEGTFKQESPLHYYGELLAIHDCLYRNMYKSRYLVFEDLDEIIVPRKHPSWLEAIKEMDPNQSKSGYVFKNMYLVPTKLATLSWYTHAHPPCKQMKLPLYVRNLDRAICDYPHFRRSKYIVRPRLIQDLDIHGICTPVEGYWQHYVPGDLGGNFHYRFKTDSTCRSPATELDLKMLNYLSALLNAVGEKICQ